MGVDDGLRGRIADAGIRELRIPTPFAVGRVNCWLVEDEPLTLIDTGPNSGKALDELEQQLGALGHRVEDLGLIVLTHQHIDHTGLASILARRSGAEIAGLEPLARLLADYSEQAEADDRYSMALMLRHGVPEDVVTVLATVSQGFRAWGAGCEVTRPLREGEAIELAERTLEVQHRPGHSPTDTCFWDVEREILIAGDHLIGHISSNPLLYRPLDGSDGRPHALLAYIESMRRTRGLPSGTMALPGHGDPVDDHAALIDSRLEMHERRAAKLLGLIDEPRTAHELAHQLWGNVAVTQAFLTLSEVIGHLDLLIQRGQAREIDDGEHTAFQATPGQ